jgi:hypothetical protein
MDACLCGGGNGCGEGGKSFAGGRLGVGLGDGEFELLWHDYLDKDEELY